MNLMTKRLFRCGLAVALSFAALGMAPVTAQGAMSDNAFAELCEKGTAEEVRSALASGANVHARDNSGWTALMWAAAFNTHPEVVQMLMAGGADVNAKDKKGGTVLMWAAIHNSNSEVVKALLKSGADIHARNKKEGWTALMTAAVLNDNPEVVKVLLENGADARAVDKEGHNVLWFAQQREKGNKKEIMQILKKYASPAKPVV